LLTGTTASDGTPEYRRQLSEKRADAVLDPIPAAQNRQVIIDLN